MDKIRIKIDYQDSTAEPSAYGSHPWQELVETESAVAPISEGNRSLIAHRIMSAAADFIANQQRASGVSARDVTAAIDRALAAYGALATQTQAAAGPADDDKIDATVPAI